MTAGTVDEAFRQAAARVRGARITDAGPSGPGAPLRRGRLAWIRRALGLDPGTTRT